MSTQNSKDLTLKRTLHWVSRVLGVRDEAFAGCAVIYEAIIQMGSNGRKFSINIYPSLFIIGNREWKDWTASQL